MGRFESCLMRVRLPRVRVRLLLFCGNESLSTEMYWPIVACRPPYIFSTERRNPFITSSSLRLEDKNSQRNVRPVHNSTK